MSIKTPDHTTFDLRNRQDVGELGRALGHEVATALIPILRTVAQEDRLTLFLGLIAEPASVFGAAGGVPMMSEALDWLKQEVTKAAEKTAASLN